MLITEFKYKELKISNVNFQINTEQIEMVKEVKSSVL